MNNSGGPQHVCFYSNKCRWSAAFINAIKDTPFKGEFKYVCVDPAPNGQRPQLPGWLKKVPTLVIRGEDEPRTDGDVMNWVSEKRLLTSHGNGGGAGGSAGGGPGPAEPEAWVGSEMGGSYTKGFSFIADDQAPIGNFEFLNGQNAPGTRTGSDIPNGGLGARGQGSQKSKRESLFDKQMEEYMRQRTSGMPPPVMRQ